MNNTNLRASLTALAILAAAAFLTPYTAQAHCDGLDGPVVKAAQKALTEGGITPVLIWVRKGDEPEIKQAFAKTLAVRKLNAEAKELADLYFFETLVRIHRTGEGAPYTGLKPAGRDLGPAIPAADKALDTRSVEPVKKLLLDIVEHGVQTHFQAALGKKQFAKHDVTTGRAYVQAYVEYIHYVEGLHKAAANTVEGHFPESHETTKLQSPHDAHK